MENYNEISNRVFKYYLKGWSLTVIETSFTLLCLASDFWSFGKILNNISQETRKLCDLDRKRKKMFYEKNKRGSLQQKVTEPVYLLLEEF